MHRLIAESTDHGAHHGRLVVLGVDVAGTWDVQRRHGSGEQRKCCALVLGREVRDGRGNSGGKYGAEDTLLESGHVARVAQRLPCASVTAYQ